MSDPYFIFLNSSTAVAKRLSVEQQIEIGYEDVIESLFIVLGDSEEMEWVAEIWDIELGESENSPTIFIVFAIPIVRN